jgi:gliding motility-associated-like protein
LLPTFELKKLNVKISAWLFFIACFYNHATGQVLDPVQFNCIQVAANGDATLNWNPVSDPNNNFTHYEIYTSLFPGIPFTAVDVVTPVTANSYTQSTTVTLSNDYYYFIQTWSTDGANNYVSENSDTLRNIFLDAEPAGNNCQNCDSSAYLNWNSPFVNDNDAPDGLQYEVWTDYPGGVWYLLQTLPFGVTNYLHIVENCLPVTMNFQIRLTMPDGCQFISNIDGDEFSDNTHPATAIITGISVNNANQGVIEWEPSASDDTDGYWIYECDGGNTILMDYVTGLNTNSYIDVFAQPYLGPLSYAIAAMDACGNADTTICATSMFLDVETFVECDEGVFMDWTPYTSWFDPVTYYIIHRAFSVDAIFSDNPFVAIDTILGSAISLTYLDDAIEYGGYNVYQIEAVDTLNDYHSFSNIASTLVPSYEPPSFVYLAAASVISADSAMVLVEMAPTAVEFSYTLQRFDESGLEWDDILVLNAVNQSSLTFYDSQLTTDVFPYSYRVIVTNACAVNVDTTNLGVTVLAEGIANQERLVNTIVWSDYSDWENDVDFYNIYRRNGLDTPFEFIAQIDNEAEHFYEDDVSELIGASGEFCYLVEAVEVPSTLLGTSHSSFSNTLCLSLEPVIWIPNSFVVDGFNRTFTPVISFADMESYKIVIFSRWGDVIFISEDITQSWDGTMKGEVVQEGTYTYYLTVKDGKGRAFERMGYVTMLVGKEK